MRCLITGGAGFIGTNLAMKIIKDFSEEIWRGGETDLLITDNLSRRGSERNLKTLEKAFAFSHIIHSPMREYHFRNYLFKKAEIEDVPSLIHSFKPKVIYHFAAQVAVTDSVISPKRDFDINAKGTLGVVLAAKDIGAKVIYTSTNKVFGDNVNKLPLEEYGTRWDFQGELKGKGINEDFSIDSSHHTPYGISKLVGEMYVREYGGIANRCSCMYGPHQNGIVDQGWLSHIAKKIIAEEKITIYGDGKQIRDVLHSDDAIDLFIKQGKAIISQGKEEFQGQAYNVGGGYENTISLLELCSMWGKEREQLNFEDWRPADQKVFYCDISKAQEHFDWKPQIGYKQGIDQLYQWTKENPHI